MGQSPLYARAGLQNAQWKTRKRKRSPWKLASFKIAVVDGHSVYAIGHKHESELFAIKNGQTSITHLPTGWIIPCDTLSFRQSKWVVEQLVKIKVDWSKLDNSNLHTTMIGISKRSVLRAIQLLIARAKKQ